MFQIPQNWNLFLTLGLLCGEGKAGSLLTGKWTLLNWSPILKTEGFSKGLCTVKGCILKVHSPRESSNLAQGMLAAIGKRLKDIFLRNLTPKRPNDTESGVPKERAR